MTHCCSEPPPEKTRWVSSQVVGDTTAHTVTISSIGFMPDILARSDKQHKGIRNRQSEVSSYRRKLALGSHPPCSRPPLEIDPEHEPRLMAFEVDEIEASTRTSRAAPDLKTPTGRQPGTLRELEICGRADKQCLTRELLQSDAIVFPQVTRLTTDQEPRKYARHQAEPGADGRCLLRCPGPRKARPFRLINQIESRDGKIGDHFPVECQREFRAVVPHDGARRFIDAVKVILQSKRETKGRAVPVQKPVA